MKRTRSIFIAFVLIALMLAVTGSAFAANKKVTGDKMFNVALTAAFTGFDPLRTNDQASTYVNAQIYETLYRIGPDGDYIPLLAESLPDFSADGKSATVHLRKGVKFHDGTPFNAQAVKYTFMLIKDPKFGSARVSLAASIASMDVLDDYTIRFNLSYPDGVLLAKLAHTNSAIVSPTAQAKQDLMIKPVGTGPYKFVSSISGSNVVLTRNDQYWDKLPVIKNVTMTIIQDESTAVARMETGEADFMPELSVPQIDRVKSIPGVTVGTSESARITYVMLRPTSYVNPLMGKKEFRVAIAKALDTRGYTETILEKYASPTGSMIGPTVFGYMPQAENYGYKYDPEAAKAAVKANHWENEKIKLFVPSTPVYTKLGEYFQANLKDAGFNNVQIEMIDWSAWLTESKAPNRFDISLAGWANVTRDGTELLGPNWESKVSARTKINNPEFDKLVYEGKTTTNRAVRIKKLDAANKLLLEEAYAVPVYNAVNIFAYNSAYTDVTNDVSGTFYLCDFTVKQ
jgi:peptide/nickel transport system substrate-binding protein